MKVCMLLLVVVIGNVYDCATATEPPPVILAARTRTIDAVFTSTRRKSDAVFTYTRQKMIPVIGNLGHAIDVDYDYEDKQIFYTDIEKNQISR